MHAYEIYRRLRRSSGLRLIWNVKQSRATRCWRGWRRRAIWPAACSRRITAAARGECCIDGTG